MERYVDHLMPKPKHIASTEGCVAVANIRYLSLPGPFRGYSLPSFAWLSAKVSVEYDGPPHPGIAGIRCDIDALGEEEFVVQIDTGEIAVRTGGWRGLLYALYTLSDLVACSEDMLPCGRMHDYPDISFRAFHFDCRGQHPAFPHMKEWMEQLSKFRYNAIILEYESYYPYRKHRILNAPDAYTEEDIRDMIRLAADRGIDIIPCLQTFAHVEHILKLTVFRHLTESRGRFTDSVVQACPCHPGTLRLFRDLIGELAAAHPSPYMHIGADETIKLGYCEACEPIVARSGKGYLYAKYINQVAQLVLEAGKTPVIWADIAMEYPESLELIAKETVLIYWNYSNETAEEFAGANALRQTGYPFWIAPAALCFPDSSPLSASDVAFGHHDRNIRAAVEAVGRYGGEGIVATAWSVDGDFAYLRSGWESISAEVVHPNAIYGIRHNVRRFLREALVPLIASSSLYAWNKEEMNETYLSRFDAVFFHHRGSEGQLSEMYERLEQRDYEGVLTLLALRPSADSGFCFAALQLMAECGRLDREFHQLCASYDDSGMFYDRAAAFTAKRRQLQQRFSARYAEWFGPVEARKETEYRFVKYEQEFAGIQFNKARADRLQNRIY